MNIQYQLTIKQGNLVFEENADFIVNASNTDLILGSGVSMAFFRHCGHELQLEMNEMLSEIHSTGYFLKKGDVVPTKAGKAKNFKHALHVAIIDSNRGVHFTKTRPTINDIKRSLINIEKTIVEYSKIHDKKQVILVLPLLGCGIGGLNKIDVIEQYKLFFFTVPSQDYCDILCKLIIYGYSDEDIELLNTLRNQRD